MRKIKPDELKELERFYNERIIVMDSYPPFDELSPEDIELLRNTYAFAVFRVNLSLNELKEETIKTFLKTFPFLQRR